MQSIKVKRNSGTALTDFLGKHELTDLIFRGARKVLEETSTAGSVFKVDPEPSRELTELEYFAIGCGYSVSHLIGLVRQLEQSPAYIRSYTRSKRLTNAGIDRVTDLVYHWENYLVRAKALEDRVLHLVNKVLHLGLDGRHVSFTLLRQNAHVKSKQKIESNLDRVHALVEPVASERNRLIHERGVLDEELRRLEFWLLAQRSLPERRDLARGRFLSEVRSVVPMKAVEAEQFIERARPVLTDLFDTLAGAYRRTRNRLAQ